MFQLFLQTYLLPKIRDAKDAVLSGSVSVVLAKVADLVESVGGSGAAPLVQILRDESSAISAGDRLEMARAFLKAVGMGVNYVLDAGDNPIVVKGTAPGTETEATGCDLSGMLTDLEILEADCGPPTVGATAAAAEPTKLSPELWAILSAAILGAIEAIIRKRFQPA